MTTRLLNQPSFEPNDSDPEVQYFLSMTGEVLPSHVPRHPLLRKNSQLSRISTEEPINENRIGERKGKVVKLAGRQKGLLITKPGTNNIEYLEKNYARLFAWAREKVESVASSEDTEEAEPETPLFPCPNPQLDPRPEEVAPVHHRKKKRKSDRKETKPSVLYEPPPKSENLLNFINTLDRPKGHMPKLRIKKLADRSQSPVPMVSTPPHKQAIFLTPELRTRSGCSLYERATVSSRRKGLMPTTCSPITSGRNRERMRTDVRRVIRKINGLKKEGLTRFIASASEKRLVRVHSELQAYSIGGREWS